MKKIVAILLACLMMIPFTMLASADMDFDTDYVYKTVYVQQGATGDGSSAANALGTLEAAYAAIGDDDGEIIVIGTYSLTAYLVAPAHAGEITIKGADANAQISVGIAETRFFTGGATVLTDIKLDTTTGSLLIVYGYNDIYVTDTVIHEKKKAAMIVAAQSGNTTKPTYNYTPKDCFVAVEGGYWDEISFGPRQGTDYVEDGVVNTKPLTEFNNINVTAMVGGNAVIAKLFLAERSYTKPLIMEGSTVTVILDGGQIDMFMGVNDNKTVTTGYAAGCLVYITENFDMSKSFENHGKSLDANRMNGGIFYGLSGENIYNNETISYTKLNNSILVIDDAVYDAILATGKIYAGSFAQTVKFSDMFPDEPDDDTTEPADTTPVVTEPVEDTTPVVTEPTDDTEKPGDGEAPDTGDIAWVIAVVAAVAVMGCAVITASKKKA